MAAAELDKRFTRTAVTPFSSKCEVKQRWRCESWGWRRLTWEVLGSWSSAVWSPRSSAVIAVRGLRWVQYCVLGHRLFGRGRWGCNNTCLEGLWQSSFAVIVLNFTESKCLPRWFASIKCSKVLHSMTKPWSRFQAQVSGRLVWGPSWTSYQLCKSDDPGCKRCQQVFSLVFCIDKAPRLSISIVSWILSSDTICLLDQFNTNSEAAMLSSFAGSILYLRLVSIVASSMHRATQGYSATSKLNIQKTSRTIQTPLLRTMSPLSARCASNVIVFMDLSVPGMESW